MLFSSTGLAGSLTWFRGDVMCYSISSVRPIWYKCLLTRAVSVACLVQNDEKCVRLADPLQWPSSLMAAQEQTHISDTSMRTLQAYLWFQHCLFLKLTLCQNFKAKVSTVVSKSLYLRSGSEPLWQHFEAKSISSVTFSTGRRSILQLDLGKH